MSSIQCAVVFLYNQIINVFQTKNMARNNYDEGCFTNLFKIGILVAIFLGVVIALYNFLDNNSRYISENYTTLFFLIIAVICIISISVYFSQKKKLNEKIDDLERKTSDLLSQKSQIENTLNRLRVRMQEKDNLFESYNN